MIGSVTFMISGLLGTYLEVSGGHDSRAFENVVDFYVHKLQKDSLAMFQHHSNEKSICKLNREPSAPTLELVHKEPAPPTLELVNKEPSPPTLELLFAS